MISNLPLEMLESVLIRAFMMLYSSDYEVGDSDNDWSYKPGKSVSAERRSFTVLSSVCRCWWNTLRRLITSKCTVQTKLFYKQDDL